MPRWFVASVFAVLLCCHGFAVFAQALASANHHPGDIAQTWADVSLPGDGLAQGDAGTTASHDNDADFDDTDAFVAEHRVVLALLPASLPASFLTLSLSAFPERPTRPPQSIAFLA